MQIPGTRKTVASVMATFTKTIADLDSVADSNEAAVVDLNSQKQQSMQRLQQLNLKLIKQQKSLQHCLQSSTFKLQTVDLI